MGSAGRTIRLESGRPRDAALARRHQRVATIEDDAGLEAARTTTADWREGTLFGHPAKRVTLSCTHGSSTFFLLPGSDPMKNLLAHELLRVGHAARLRCGCVPQVQVRGGPRASYGGALI